MTKNFSGVTRSASTSGPKQNQIGLSIGLSFLVAGCLLSCVDHQNVNRAFATVDLVNLSGTNVGKADLTEDSQGVVTLQVSVRNLPPGTHGIHFHEAGVANPAEAFNSAGEHYNPASKKHGLANPQGRHAGDLPNLVIDAQGNGTLTTTTNFVTITDGPITLFDGNGSSLIIHTNADDQSSDPSGNSGGRIAGGVVRRP